VTAVKAADLVETLSGAGPFTVFAPNNAAFDKIGTDALNAILADKKQLTDILMLHVLAAKVMSSQLTDGLVSGDLTFTNENGDWYVAGPSNKAKIITADVGASNGVAHVIDTVLLPAASGTTDASAASAKAAADKQAKAEADAKAAADEKAKAKADKKLADEEAKAAEIQKQMDVLADKKDAASKQKLAELEEKKAVAVAKVDAAKASADKATDKAKASKASAAKATATAKASKATADKANAANGTTGASAASDTTAASAAGDQSAQGSSADGEGGGSDDDSSMVIIIAAVAAVVILAIVGVGFMLVKRGGRGGGAPVDKGRPEASFSNPLYDQAPGNAPGFASFDMPSEDASQA